MLLEVDYVPKAGKWGVFDRDVPLTPEPTKQAAKSFAESQASPGDTIQVYTKDGRLDDEFIVDEDGSLTSAGIDSGGGQNGMFGGMGGGGGLFGGGGGLF